MGASGSKSAEIRVSQDVRLLKEKVRLLQEEVKELLRAKEKERAAFESDRLVFAFREAEWKQERKKLKEEVKMLRVKVEDKEDRIREMEEDGGKNEKGWEAMGVRLLMGQIEEERIRRDAAAEKWKRLYLEIKTELDELIERTCYHDDKWSKEELCSRFQDSVEIDNLKESSHDKDEKIKSMEAALASMHREQRRREREMDILRQSCRIITYGNGKTSNGKKKWPKTLRLR